VLVGLSNLSDLTTGFSSMTAKILVVDDELTVERLFRQLLRKEIRANEIELFYASNGQEALDQLKKIPDISLVLTDINMPIMDGLTLLGEIQTMDRIIKTVVISAYSDYKNIRIAMNRGAFDFLTKPVNADALNLAIDRTLKIVDELQLQHERIQQAYAALEYEAHHDRLTDLPNRTAFTKYLVEQLQQAVKHSHLSYAVLYIELQRINVVNDTFGFLAVDDLVSQAAERLRICQNDQVYLSILADFGTEEFNKSEQSVLTGFEPSKIDLTEFSDFDEDFDSQTNKTMLARFGGNSFVMLLSGLNDTSQLTAIVKNIQHQISRPFEVNGCRQFVNATIGLRRLSNLISQPDTPEQVLKDVNTATYYAKRSKRGYEVFTPAMQDASHTRWQLESDLRLAIENQEFCLHYQPLVCLATESLIGFEALVRWQHPTRGMVSPAIFIELAEETELILEIGEIVLSQACNQAIAWQHQFPHFADLSISVNVSPLQCQDSLLIEQVTQILNQTELSGSKLKLEVTESSFANIEASRQLWQEITKMGVSLSIDDFGTGYSCLSRLHELPISTLKIDQSFVRNIGKGEEHLEVIQTILSLAKNLGMTVVAEGIETVEQKRQLQSMNCNFGQGYHFSKPLNIEHATEFISKSLQDLRI
jgi:predicted signal transduction protein with EAL and GGDEF domain